MCTKQAVRWWLDRLADAEALEREVVEEADRRGERVKVAATARANLAQVLALEHRYAEAEPLYRRAIEDLSDGPASRGVVRNNFSVLLSNTGRASEADAELDRAIDDLRGALGDDSHTTRSARLNQAIRRVTSGKGLNALAALGDTDKRMVASLGPDHPSAPLARRGVQCHHSPHLFAERRIGSASLAVQGSPRVNINGSCDPERPLRGKRAPHVAGSIFIRDTRRPRGPPPPSRSRHRLGSIPATSCRTQCIRTRGTPPR